MDKVKLGSQGAVVSRMVLGCMGMSESYGERNDVESAAAEIRLTPQEVAELEAAVPQDEIAGDRYAPGGSRHD